MQPKTEVKFDKKHFDRIKRTIRNMAVGKRESVKNNFKIFEIPDEVGIQLTNKCNLRCKTCFQWNDDGFFNNYSNEQKNNEIDIDVICRILDETKEQRSNLYLWGGEPLSYGKWEQLSLILEKDPRWTVFCTNGVNINKKIESILRISHSLAMLISVDGFEKENDAVRGAGVYNKVITNIDNLLDLKEKGEFSGEISVNCVISEAMVGKLYDFAIMMEAKGINTLYLCFPWYLPHTTSQRMDSFFKEHFPWLLTFKDDGSASWHSYKYQLNPILYEKLLDDLNKISNRNWNIRIRYQPALEPDEVIDFLSGEEKTAQKRTKCVGLFNRMNVLPNGRVTVCKMFPEFEVGNLNTHSVKDIWNGEEINKIRDVLNNQLMPVCSKCILLYLHGV
jgi:sulfatase maturation enzyme AslB (radical SAM superfamily)